MSVEEYDGTNKNQHLDIEERKIIERGITNGSTKTAIAITLGKDNSTIGKEIKQHRKKVYTCSLPLECANYKKCKNNRECYIECAEYLPFKCVRRDRSPGACNGCSQYSSCRFTKYRYIAENAEHEYKITLVESRQGVNLTTAEAREISDIITPLLKQGQSPYSILAAHPEINISEKTMYNYLEDGVFSCLGGATNMDLRRQLSRKIPRKKKAGLKKRESRQYLIGRTYGDYLEYLKENPNVKECEMDTVYNSETTGPFVQTFMFKKMAFLFAFIHPSKEAIVMKNGVDNLESVIGKALFEKHVHILKTDRGSEFTKAEEMEVRLDGTRRTHVFYCDPMCSHQKGTLENKHEMFRYICPKECDLYALGLVNQNALNEVLSHINSTPLEFLDGKSPIEYMRFMCPDLWERFEQFGIVEIPNDKITLKPFLLKKYKTDLSSL